MTEMTAIFEHEAPVCWDRVFADVNAWRGECMHHFSAVEHAITQTLLVLAPTQSEAAPIRLRHLIGQRLEDLAAAIGPAGPFAVEGKNADRHLADYREQHETFRAQICHARIKVTVDSRGDWLLVMRMLTIRRRQVSEETLVLEKAQAQAHLKALKRHGQALAAALGQLRKEITPQG